MECTFFCYLQSHLSLLKFHLEYQCLYENSMIKGKKKEKNVSLEYKPIDEEVQEKINENTTRGDLISRVLTKNGLKDTKSFDFARKVISGDSNSFGTNPLQIEQDRKGKKGQKHENQQGKKKQFETYDFLEDLYNSV